MYMYKIPYETNFFNYKQYMLIKIFKILTYGRCQMAKRQEILAYQDYLVRNRAHLRNAHNI